MVQGMVSKQSYISDMEKKINIKSFAALKATSFLQQGLSFSHVKQDSV